MLFNQEHYKKVEYLTLSHCWGCAYILRLLECTLLVFQTEIPVSELPQSFLDAMMKTAELGYKYIWIDSLCIIQDSTEDWIREATLMGKVYSYAVCTIAAVAASNSHDGLFQDRSALTILPCQLRPPDETQELGLYICPVHQLPEPLHARAWVFQERCLSPRTLNFDHDQISYTWVQTQASERGPKPKISQTLWDTKGLKRLFQRMIVAYPFNQDNSLGGLPYRWWILVKDFSNCKITYNSEKPDAIRGLVEQLQSHKKIAL